MLWLSVCCGPAGANGLAAARDFLTPVARFEERECDFTVLHKFNGQLFQAQQVRRATAAGFVCMPSSCAPVLHLSYGFSFLAQT